MAVAVQRRRSVRMIQLVRPEDLSKRLSVDVSTLYKWVRKGKFPKPIKMAPRATAWKLCDVEEWLEARQ